MAEKLKKFRASVPGMILEALIYAAMLIAVMIFFTGNGQFIYEAF